MSLLNTEGYSYECIYICVNKLHLFFEQLFNLKKNHYIFLSHHTVTNISKDHTAYTLRVKQSMKTCLWLPAHEAVVIILQNVKNYLPTTWYHIQNDESSTTLLSQPHISHMYSSAYFSNAFYGTLLSAQLITGTNTTINTSIYYTFPCICFT